MGQRIQHRRCRQASVIQYLSILLGGMGAVVKIQIRLGVHGHDRPTEWRQLILGARLDVAKSLRRIMVVQAESAARPRNIDTVQQRVGRQFLVEVADEFLHLAIVTEPSEHVRRAGFYSSISRPSKKFVHVALRLGCEPDFDFAYRFARKNDSAEFVWLTGTSSVGSVRESLLRFVDLA